LEVRSNEHRAKPGGDPIDASTSRIRCLVRVDAGHLLELNPFVPVLGRQFPRDDNVSLAGVIRWQPLELLEADRDTALP
jgi:hypothetical protein